MATQPEKIIFEVEIDGKQAESSLGGLEDRIEKLKELRDGEDIGSKAFQDLSKDIQKAEAAIKDVELQFESLDFEQKLTAGSDAVVGIAGGFAAAEGAAALFGAESEALEETLAKVAGALALSQGLRDMANGAIALRKLGGAAEIARKAQVALNNAVKANPYTALAVAIAAVAAAVAVLVVREMEHSKAMDLSFQRTEALNRARATAEKSMVSQKVKLESLVSVAKDESLSLKDREEAVKQLNELSPQYLGDLTTQNVLTEEGTKLIDDYSSALQKRAMAQALEESLVELYKERIDLQKEEIGWFDSMITNGLETTKMFGNILTGQESIDDALDKNFDRQKKRNQGILDDNLAAHDKQIEATSKELELAQKEVTALDATTRAYEHKTHSQNANTEATKEQAKVYEELFKITSPDEEEAERTVAIEEDKFNRLSNFAMLYGKVLEAEAEAEKKRIAEAEAARQDKLDKAQQGLDFLSGLNNAFVKDEIKREKIRKTLAVAQIAIDTARGVSAAIAAGAGVPFPGNIPAILTGVTAVLSGIASAKGILGEADSGLSASSITAAATGSEGVPINNISNTASLVDQDQQNITQRVVVLESDITGAQNSVADVEDSATF